MGIQSILILIISINVDNLFSILIIVNSDSCLLQFPFGKRTIIIFLHLQFKLNNLHNMFLDKMITTSTNSAFVVYADMIDRYYLS